MTSNGDAFGSLAALFTTGTGDGAPAVRAGAASAPEVTTVLVGNLPVMAGLWTTQMADDVARTDGPTALVRLERGEVTVELLRADGRQVPPPGPGAVAGWLPRASAQLRRWLVCVPADASPAEVLEAGNDITILSGSDEAAITGAYLRLKHLADEGIHRGEPLRRVGLVVAGATPEQAAQAAARLADAARSFLSIEVEMVGRLPRIERVESSARATYPAAECPSLAELARALREARESASLRFDRELPAAPAPAGAAVEPKRPLGLAGAPVAAPSAPTPIPPVAVEPPARPVPPAPPASAPAHVDPPVRPAAASPAPASPATVAAAPGAAAVPVRSGVALPARLLPLLAGLRPLGIACPVAADVELGIDARHVLHVVGRPEQLARVRAARNWALLHRELLGLAFAELQGGFEVRERVLLSDAREAVTLHGSGVLLDALVVADTPAGRVQVIVPLNDESSCG